MTNGCSWTTWLKFKTSHPYLAEKAKRWCHQVGWHWNNCQFRQTTYGDFDVINSNPS